MEPHAAAGEGSGLKVLVADDSRTNRVYLEGLLREDGHRVVGAADGAEAVALFEAEHPDLVLMDIVMPGVDGLEAARRISRSEHGTHTPIIFLTALADEKTMLGGLDIGEDYIRKPIKPKLLRAKLRAFIRLLQAQRQMSLQQKRIEKLNDAMRREGEVAAHVLGRVLAHTELPDGRFLLYRVQPSEIFSGDMVLARRAPGGHLYLLLADAVGHGLPAAINILPLFFPFDAMARKGCTLSSIARELNRRVADLLPVDRFVAATLACVDPASGSLEVWNGGNPPALVLDVEGAVIQRVDSMQMALGLNEDSPALFEPQRLHCAQGSRLLMCSDGIWENAAFAGADPAQPIAHLVAASEPVQVVDMLIGAAVEAGQSDDLSAVVAVAHAPELAPAPSGKAAPARRRSLATRLALQLGPEVLAHENPVDAVLVMANSIGLVESFPSLPLVLAELFANALDYGVLGLDGTGKYRSAADYQAFFEERQRRSVTLAEGFVVIEMEPDYFGGAPVLRLRVSDSGQGFDWRNERPAEEEDEDAGHGLQLVRRLAASLIFNSQGSEVVALIPAAKER